jgi:hypothetical protein
VSVIQGLFMVKFEKKITLAHLKINAIYLTTVFISLISSHVVVKESLRLIKISAYLPIIKM